MRRNILGDWALISAMPTTPVRWPRSACSSPQVLGSIRQVPILQRSQAHSRTNLSTASVPRSGGGAHHVGSQTTLAKWRKTAHTDAAALAAAWRQDRRAQMPHPRRSPRLAVALDGRSRADLFDFEAVCAWLKLPDVGLDALVLADLPAGGGRVAWHWPVRRRIRPARSRPTS